MNIVKTRLSVIVSLMAALFSAGAALGDYFVGDLFLARTVQEVRIAAWEETMEVASLIGEGLPMIAMAVALLVYFLWKKQKAEGLITAGAVLSFGINPMLKMLVDRPRPTEEMVAIWQAEAGSGFPSGHAFTAVILFGLLYYLAPLLLPWRRAVYVARGGLVVLILLIGLSRVYLGVHWPSDVIGGYVIGGLVLWFLVSSYRWMRGPVPDFRSKEVETPLSPGYQSLVGPFDFTNKEESSSG